MRRRSGSGTRVSAEAVRRREGRSRPSDPCVAQRDPRARPTLLKLDPYARRSSSPHEIALRRCKLRTPPRRAVSLASVAPSRRRHPRTARERGKATRALGHPTALRSYVDTYFSREWRAWSRVISRNRAATKVAGYKIEDTYIHPSFVSRGSKINSFSVHVDRSCLLAFQRGLNLWKMKQQVYYGAIPW